MTLDTYLRDIGNHRILSKEEEISLHERIQKGDERAKDELVENNLKLVVKIAKRYTPDSDLILDYIQEGNIGLVKAAEKFDPVNFDTRFSTYAGWWVRSKINNFIIKNRTIRIPNHAQEDYARLNELESDHLKRHGEPPSYNYLAEIMSNKKKNYRPKDIMQMHYNLRTKGTISLDRRVNNNSESTFLDFIADNTMDPLEKLAERTRTRILNEYLARLDEDTGYIMRLHYIEDMSKRDISAKLGRNTDWVKTRISRGKRRLYHIISIDMGEEELENLVR